jgi:hypothetical protein
MNPIQGDQDRRLRPVLRLQHGYASDQRLEHKRTR